MAFNAQIFKKTHTQNTFCARLLYEILMKSVKNMNKAVLWVHVTYLHKTHIYSAALHRYLLYLISSRSVMKCGRYR